MLPTTLEDESAPCGLVGWASGVALYRRGQELPILLAMSTFRKRIPLPLAAALLAVVAVAILNDALWTDDCCFDHVGIDARIAQVEHPRELGHPRLWNVGWWKLPRGIHARTVERPRHEGMRLVSNS